MPPTLLEHWPNGQPVDSERTELAKQDFEFYAEDLPEANPYPKYANPDSNAVETARAYLKKFTQDEQLYAAMLSAAGAGIKPFVFNDKYPGSRGLIVNKFPVNPGFTKKGYEAFMKELKDPERYFYGEEWVLGPTPTTNPADKEKLLRAITDRYKSDFIKNWRDYLHATSFRGLQRDSRRSRETGEADYERFTLASRHVRGVGKYIGQFQRYYGSFPACAVGYARSVSSEAEFAGERRIHARVTASAECCRPDSPHGSRRRSADHAGTGCSDAGARYSCSDRHQFQPRHGPAARRRKGERYSARSAQTRFPESGCGGGQQSGGWHVCSRWLRCSQNIPFNPASTTDAALADVDALLKPGQGKIFDPAFAKILTHVGSSFAPNADSDLKPSGPFLNAMNRLLGDVERLL